MNYFKHFPAVAYTFGSNEDPAIFRNISIYATVLDEIKDNVSFYNDYYIQEFERPDQVSNKLYKTPNFHWTLYLLNNKLKDSGWPLSNRELITKTQSTYTFKVITTRTNIATKMKIGQTLTGLTSGATATVSSRHISLGQILVKDNVGNFLAGETITSTNSSGDIESIVVKSFENEVNSAHHYEDGDGVWQDLGINSTTGDLEEPSALWTEVTNFDRMYNQNETLKQIRVIKPSVIVDVVNSFKEAVR